MLDQLEKLALQVNHLILFIWFHWECCFKGCPVLRYTYLVCIKVFIWLVYAIYGLFVFMVYYTEAYSESYEISKIGLYAKLANNWKLLIFFAKTSS